MFGSGSARDAFRGRNEAGSHNLNDGFRLIRELDQFPSPL